MRGIRWAVPLLLSACWAANAQRILFTTLGPGEAFNGTTPGLTFGGGEFWNLSGNNGEILTAAFTPSATMVFSHVDLALGYNYVTFNDLTGPPSVDVTLAGDSGGSPGSAIETIHITNAFAGSSDPALLTATSSLQPVLEQGVQYWLVLQPPDLLHTAFAWMPGPAGAPNVLTPGQFLALNTALEPQWSPGSFGPGISPGFAVYGGASATSALPAIPQNGIVSAASYTAPVSSASWISIFGSNLSLTTRGWQSSDFNGATLPVTLDGVSVLINGAAASVSFVSPGQVNAELPDLDPNASTFTLQVITSQGASVPVVLPNAPIAPALFTFIQNGQTYPLATLADGTLISPNSPVKAGNVVVLYGSGFGASTPAIPSGMLVSTPEPLAESAGVVVTIGGLPAQLSYAGITEAGLDQINVTVPQLPAGDQAVAVSVNGTAAQSGIVLPTD